MTDIVERLGYHHEHPVSGKTVLINPDGPEAATEIKRLRADAAAWKTLAETPYPEHRAALTAGQPSGRGET